MYFLLRPGIATRSAECVRVPTTYDERAWDRTDLPD